MQIFAAVFRGVKMRRGLLIATMLVTLPTTAAFAGAGRIKSFVGDVSILRVGRVLRVVPGLPVEQGDIVRTGKDGRVGMTFSDGARMALLPSSRVSIDEFSYDATTIAGSFITSVHRGKVGFVSGAIAKSKRDAMRVRTPTTLLGVRGTRFLVEVK